MTIEQIIISKFEIRKKPRNKPDEKFVKEFNTVCAR
jgi:hypothetical protein